MIVCSEKIKQGISHTGKFTSVCMVLLLLINFSANADSSDYIMEGLPPHLKMRAEQQILSSQLDKLVPVQDYFVDPIKKWNTDRPIRVCFFGGSQNLRRRIAEVANLWTVNGETSLRFDFGDMDAINSCGQSGKRYEIRVGFAYKGYWSTVGTDSVNLAAQYEQSMNLALFNINPPEPQEFNRVVLHEFGHAIGLKHEHQIYDSPCPLEFDWDAIYEYLQGPPNNWDIDRINHNLRPIQAKEGTYDFDKESVMLYTFPRYFYKSSDPQCYTTGNHSLSDGDILAVRKIYSNDPAVVSQQRVDAYNSYASQIRNLGISQREKIVALSNLDGIYNLENISTAIDQRIFLGSQEQINYEDTFHNSNFYKNPSLKNLELKDGSIKIDAK